MKKLLTLFLSLLLIFSITGCKGDSPGSEIQLKSYGFDGVNEIRIQNCHNGECTILQEDADIAAVTAFLSEIVGVDPGSGKGYYEGSYAIKCIYSDGEEFSLAFGDSDCFYMGKGGDGYPIRYLLTDMTVTEDVVPFFARFDQSISD